MSDMHSSMQSSSSSSSSYHHSHQQAHADLGNHSSTEAATPAAQPDGCMHGTSKSVSNTNSSSSGSKEPMDPATAAAAAALGAEADRLLKALNLRMEQHHPERSKSKQQGRRRLKGIMPAHRGLAAAAGDEDGLGFGDDSGCGVFGGDEPICIPVEYLRL
jgi:hypothetical protein